MTRRLRLVRAVLLAGTAWAVVAAVLAPTVDGHAALAVALAALTAAVVAGTPP